MEKINYRYQRTFYYLSLHTVDSCLSKNRRQILFRAVARGQLSHNRPCNTCYRRDGRPANEIYGEKKKVRSRLQHVSDRASIVLRV